MFVDEKKLHIKAGKGGDGVALFRREIYVPRGGPDGGDGGLGGHVFIEGRSNMHALSHLAYLEKIVAEDGQKGGHKTSTGRSGESQTILVPLGTIVEEETENGWKQILEIVEEGQRYKLADGGNGGWGNWHFKSSIQQAPDRWNPGLPGEEKDIRLTLKLIADIGLVGLPNAGKSTFLSSVSAAKPKIANYPFTTLQPQLGVAEVSYGTEKKQVIIADLPGLIEGASAGKGLGIAFLKHVERTRTILHFLDISADEEELLNSYRVIRKELETWSEVLGNKPELLVLTKIDTVLPEEVEAKQAFLAKETGKKVYAISAASHQGVTDLLTDC
jgi:GTP-binding protein